MHVTRVNGLNLADYVSEHGGHVLTMWEQPAEWARVLLDFLD